MGALMMKLFRPLWSKQEARILLLGLDASGKTTTLYKLRLGEVTTTIPTIGFNVERLRHKNIEITAWDVGGRDKIRPLWRHYYQNTNAIIFFVDSNDRERIAESAEEISRICREDELRGAPLLVFANKQDLPNAMSVAEVTDKLGLHSVHGRQWHIEASCATSGDGLYEGLEWLTSAIVKYMAANPPTQVAPTKESPEGTGTPTRAPETPGNEAVTPEKITPEKITPEKITPEKITPEKITPEKAVRTLQVPPTTDTVAEVAQEA